MRALPDEAFARQWAGFATTHLPYRLDKGETGPHWKFIQRCGERAEEYAFKAFLSTREDDEVAALTLDFPKRWHVEEFFHANQALGWKRAGTMNLHIRYGHMTLALVAQAIIHQFRQRVGDPYGSWDAEHLAKDVFNGLDGDIRVSKDTILVTKKTLIHTFHGCTTSSSIFGSNSVTAVQQKISYVYTDRLLFILKHYFSTHFT
jgi:hypothetical protein